MQHGAFQIDAFQNDAFQVKEKLPHAGGWPIIIKKKHTVKEDEEVIILMIEQGML
jgi:hypothetical protein